MCSFRNLVVVALVGLVSVGCGNNGMINAKGRVVKGGQPFLLPDGQAMRVFFAPTNTEGSRYDSYAASYNADDGSFEVVGKDGRGLPAGQYQVGIQVMEGKEDLLGGRLLGPTSGITLEVTSGSNDLVIDLDKTPFDKALNAAKQKTAKKGRPKGA